MEKLIIIVSIFLLVSCSGEQSDQSASNQQGIATVSGIINNPVQTKAMLVKGTEKFETSVIDNRFEFEIPLKEAGYFKFRYSNIQSKVHLQPGDELVMEFDVRNYQKGITYSGKGSVKNNYLADRITRDREKSMEQSKLLNLEPQAFLIEMKNEEKEYIDRLESFPKLKDKAFKAIENAEIVYDFATRALYYPKYSTSKNPSQEIDRSFYDFAKNLDINNSNNLQSDNFQNFLSQYTGILGDLYMQDNPSILNEDAGWTRSKFHIIKEQFQNDEIKSFLMYQALKDQIRYFGINGMDDLLAEFQNTNNNQIYLDEIMNQYNRWTRLAKGQPAPSFIYEDINGTELGLENWRGKFVYVDVWATWCGPCKREIPYLEKLLDKFKGNDKVVFASISIDRDKNAWERMVTKDDMRGIQLYASASASIQKDYRISGIPRFLLIDPHGKIINVHAPRPSSGRLEPMLNELIKNWSS